MAPGPARRLGEQLCRIVQAGSAGFWECMGQRASVSSTSRASTLSGTIAVNRTDVLSTIEWRCTECGDEGQIHGWEGSPFDLRRNQSLDVTTGQDICITLDDASVLREIEFIGDESERIVLGGRSNQASSS